ncbi:MAG: diguanylate cyclase, partial [Candidatus Neomarinimicrobiota bacterium]
IAISLFIIGSLVVLGLYHMGLYSLREYTKSPFYFGLFSLTIGLRALVTGDIPLHFFFPQFPWWALIRIEYLTFYLGLPLFVNFQHSVFSDEFPRRIALIISGICALFASLVLVTPPWIFTASLPAFFVVAFISALLCLFFTIKAVNNQRVGARIFLAASILLFIIFVNDILYSAEILFTGYFISYGILLFMVSQAFLLSYRFSDSFRTIDRHKKELRLHKDHLEDIVANRMSELTEANNKLKTLTMIDGLTEIPNRRRMDNYLLSEWQRMRRDKQSLAFIICDIDFFKLFNDNYGHQAGDECLKRVAGAINAAINRPGDLVARYGGEEFGAILPNTELAGAIQVAERMRQNIEELNLIHEYSKVSGHITISAGVAVTIPTIESSPQELIELADQRLYKAKNSGRNRVVAD